MKKIAKRGLLVLLTVALIISAFCISSIAAGEEPATYSKSSNSGQRDVVCTTLDGTSASSYYTGSYTYANLSNQSSSALYTSLQTLMRSTHTYTSSYDDCHYEANKTDCENNNTDYLSLIYTSYDATMSEWNGWNREHVWPQSLGGGNTKGGGADLHHIRPSDAGVNSSRGNKKYGEAGNGATEKYGTDPAVGVLGGTYNSTYFEPLDNVKGDVARICLYVYVRWGSAWGADSITDVFQSTDVLLEWCEMDPVDTWEMGRNEVVEDIQGNRNVFIDYPEYAWILFGEEVPDDMTTPSGMARSGGTSGSTTPPATSTAPAVNTKISFNLGANGTASHYDGSSKTSYSETVDGYTLNVTSGTNFYTGARDAKGNSCFKLGTSKNAGSFAFTVPDDVTSVTLEVGKYKANTTKITVNGKSYTISGSSDNGAYDSITIDTTSTKRITLSTVSGGLRAMVNSITYVIETGSSGTTCEHTNTTTTTVDATCTEAGSTTVTCDDCGETVSTEEIAATGHVNTTTKTDEATCTETGSEIITCNKCGATVNQTTIPATGHSYSGDTCTVCGAKAGASITVSTVIGDYAVANNWVNSYKYPSISIGEITVTASGGQNTGKYYTNGKNWRIYQNETPSIVVKAADGYTISTVTITYSVANTGVLTLNEANITSGTAVEVNASSVTFGVGNTETATNGQVQITGIEVVYKASSTGGDTTCEHVNTTTTTVDATCTEAGSTTVTCDDCGETVSTEEIAATGHNYVGNTCENCGESLSTDTLGLAGKQFYIATIRTSGNYFYMTSNLGTASTKRYQAVDSGLTQLPSSIADPKEGYVFEFVLNDNGTYSIFVVNGDENNYLGHTSDNSGTLVAASSALQLAIERADDGTYTIHYAASDAERYLALNGTSGNNFFAFYKSGQKQNLHLIEVGGSSCSHTNQTTTTVDATCTEAGSITVTCDDCGATISTTPIPATGHNYDGDTCVNCGDTLVTCPLDLNKEYNLFVEIDSTKYYVTATVTSGKFGATTNSAAAAAFTIEIGGNVGEYLLSFYDETSTKQYVVISDSSTGFSLTTDKASASVFCWNEDLYSLIDAATDRAIATSAGADFRSYAYPNQTYFWAQFTPDEAEPIDPPTVDPDPTPEPEEPVQQWELVTDASTLKAGDKIVIVSGTFIAGNISSSFMASVNGVTINDNVIATLPEGAVILTLGGSSGAWTLSNDNIGKLLGATANKKLAWDSGTTTWSITIESNNATIQNGTSTYGRFLYNVSNPRFTTYTSNTSQTMLLPQIYKLTTVSGGGSSSTPDDGEHNCAVDGHIDNGCGYCKICEVAIRTASLVLGNDLSFQFGVNVVDKNIDTTGAYMEFKFNGPTTTVNTFKQSGDYLYFIFEGIAPDQMTLPITATLYIGGNPAARIENYTVEANLLGILEQAKATNNTTLIQLINETLLYGQAAQDYTNNGNKDVNTEGLTSAGANASTSDAMGLQGNKDQNVKITAVGVHFDRYNSYYVKIYVSDTSKFASLTVDGVTYGLADMINLGDGYYQFYFGAVDATSFDTRVTIELYSSEAIVTRLTYSINAYAYAVSQDAYATDTMKALAKALYNYGKAAEAYYNANKPQA